MRGVILVAAVALWLALPTVGRTQPALLQVERRVSELPAGLLYYRLETFPSLAEAEAAAGPYGVAGQTSDGQAWLFTLGPPGRSTPGGMVVAEVGPLSSPTASEYVLRVQESNTPPGRPGDMHTHPGVESWYVLEGGEQTIRTPAGDSYTTAGQASIGPPAGTPMQVLANRSLPRRVLTLLVLDAAQPFSSPAELVTVAQPTPTAPTRPAAAPAQIPR